MGNDKSAAVRKALEESLPVEMVDKVLRTLDRQKVFRYHNEGDINLVNTNGRVLIALLEDNTLTQRALSVYLGLSEAMIDKTIKTLINQGLVIKTKSQRQNIYKVDVEKLKNHPDIQHLIGVIDLISRSNSHHEEEPF
jgi:biotin operon repressor